MPARVPVAGALEVAFTINDTGSIDAGSRFFLAYTGTPPSVGDLNSLSSDTSGYWSATVNAVTRETESLRKVVITDLSADDAARGTWEGDYAGTLSAGDPLPSGTAACLNHTIARRYRGGKPKTFLRCGDTSYLSGTNEWTTGAATAILTQWQAWIADILAVSDIGITLTNIINISYVDGFTAFETPSGRYKNLPVYRTTPRIDTISDTAVAVKLGSQRRRLNV
jgi:hypothetical protein